MKNETQHHSRYVSEANVIHKCMATYLDTFSNMPPEWYINSVYYSCNRKGFKPSRIDIAKYFMLYRPEWRGKVILQDGSEFILIQ
jgi:hypothetical protein